jgi:hypothetical protein
VVRGGSYLERPARCRAAVRYGYPAWQKVHNVGFRIVVNETSWASHRPKVESADAVPPPGIRHRFLGLDESRKQLLFVDEYHPENDWTLKLPAEATPRDLQAIGNHRVLVASGGGYIECDVRTRKIVRQVDCVDDMVISLRRLPSGNTLLIGRDSGMLYEVDPDGQVIRQVKLPVTFARVMRFTPAGTLVVCPDSQIMEFDMSGNVIRTVPLKVQEDHRPAKRSGYHIVKKPNGNYLVSTCYAVGIAEVDPSGKIVHQLGGRNTPEAAAMNWIAFCGFQVLPNGNTITTTWNGHGAEDSLAGPQLVEFDSQGKLVWQWHDSDRAGSILAVIVVDQLDTADLLEEKGHILDAAK